MQTPAMQGVTESEAEPLDQAQHSKYRSQVAKCFLFSQDRADILCIANELCQKVSNPDEQSMVKLQKLVRFLNREGQRRQVFRYGKMDDEVTTFTHSDWAGYKETRKSSSAGVTLLGNHTLKAYMRKQKIIAKSSAEAELYAAALGASKSKGIVSLRTDLGHELKPVLSPGH